MALYQDGILISGANTLPKMTLAEYNALPADQRPTYWERLDADYDDILSEKTDIATVESGTTASKAYSTGELLYYNGTLHRAKVPIASGATFTEGTNVEPANVSSSIYGLNTDCKSFIQDNLDGNNKLIGRRNNVNFRELYFNNFPLNASSSSANVGSYYTPPQDVLFPIMSLNIGVINIRIQGGTGKLFLLGADGSSVSGTHTLFGHVSYTV